MRVFMTLSCCSRQSSTLLAVLLLLASRKGKAQESLTLSGEAACDRCRLTLTPVATLLAPPREKAFVIPNAIARDSRGLIYVADAWGGPNVFVYDERGNVRRV